MEENPRPGFVARNNEVIGSTASIVALLAAAGCGAGLMLGTGTRGVAAILTVLTITGGIFALALLVIGGSLRAVTPAQQWDDEETGWRLDMGLAPLTPDDEERAARSRRVVAAAATAAIVAGLAMSLGPDLF